MRILLAHNPYARPSGEELAVAGFASLLRSRGHRVKTLLAPPVSPEAGFGTQAAAFFTGVYNPAARRRMARALDRFRPDLVQVQNLYPFLSPAILSPCRQRGIPVVMRCPNYRLFCPTATHLSRGEPCERCLGRAGELWCVARNCEGSLVKSVGYAVRNAAARISGSIVDNVSLFVVLSEFQRRKFFERGLPDSRLAVVPNPAPRRLDGEPAGGGQCVSFIGRVSPEKGIEDFLAAARRLPDLSFEVAGAVRRTEARLAAGAPENVKFHGYLPAADLDLFVLRTRVLVFPSRWWEGFPNVLAQVMVAGKPVLASDLGAVPEIVEAGTTGLLFRPGDVDDLVAKLSDLYGDPDRCRRLGAAGRAKAVASYSEDRVYEATRAAYEKARLAAAS